MKKFNAWMLFLVFFGSVIPLMGQTDSDEETTTTESTGGIYPSEAQGPDTNVISPKREAPPVPKIQAPEFTRELRVAAQTQNEIRPNYYLLEGYVDLVHEGVRLQADRAEYDANTNELIAIGNVVLDQENQHLTGEKLEMNLETKKGTMYNVRGFVPPQIFFWGSKLEKIGDDEYKIYDGIFTECSQIVPHWRLNTTTAKMTVDEYISFKNFTLRAKSIPIFYSPFMMWPIKRERATGFLFPSIGLNNNKGTWFGGSFFWAMGKSIDSTYWLDHYAERGWGGGSEFRYAASKESDGVVKGYFTNDELIGNQYAVEGHMRQELPWDMEMRATADYFSSIDYIKDYSNSLQRAVSQTNIAQGFLTRNWSYYTLNVLGEYAEKLGSSSTSSYFHLPEVEFQSRQQKLGPTPFFVSALTSFSELGRGTENRAGSTKFQFERLDFFPSISFPITYLAWLSVTPTYGYRVTHYTAQRDRQQVVDEPVTRGFHDLTLEFRGPNFGRVFDTPGMGYSKKWKHAIEPQVTFGYTQNIPESEQIVIVDPEKDSILGVKEVTYSITNLIYAKRPVKAQKEYKPDEYQYYKPETLEDQIESAWEFISWRLSQSYFFKSDSFDLEQFPDLKRLSPISSLLRVNPAQNYSVDFTTEYDVNFSQLTKARVGATLRDVDAWFANVSYGYSNRVVLSGPSRSSNSLQVNAGFGLWNNRLAVHGEVGADLTEKQFLSRSLGLTWNDDCFSIGVDYKYFSDVIRLNGKEGQITFSISLPNIGSLVNYQSGATPRRF